MLTSERYRNENYPGPMTNKPPPIKGLHIRIPSKRRGFINQGSGLHILETCRNLHARPPEAMLPFRLTTNAMASPSYTVLATLDIITIVTITILPNITIISMITTLTWAHFHGMLSADIAYMLMDPSMQSTALFLPRGQLQLSTRGLTFDRPSTSG